MSENSETANEKKEPVVFESVKICYENLGLTYEYFMTNSLDAVEEKLKKLGYREIYVEDWRLNSFLDTSVSEKMKKLGCCYAMTFSNGASSLYYWCESKNKSYKVRLDELLKNSDYLIARQIFKMKESFERTIRFNKNNKKNLYTPLTLAVMSGSVEFAKKCIDGGEDVNFCDIAGLSPLCWAVGYKNTEMVKLLVKNGADVNFRIENKKSIYSYAVSINSDDSCSEILRILEEAGAKTGNIGVITKIPKKHMTFSDCLEFFIQVFMQNNDAPPSQIYKNTLEELDKKAFSKIRSRAQTNPSYRPKKNKVFLLAIGMNLTVDQTEQLLFSAGYAFAETSKFDMTIKDFIQKRNYKIEEIENALFKATGKYLGRKAET
ncbi:MAG: ankyrin repeat domain-containing protein [Treponema sp.]|nr:ankyrin repeat domain-containing protein [Treponema sp.]